MASEPQNPSLEPLSLSETSKEEEGSVSKKQLKKLAKEAEKKKAKEAHKAAERQQQNAASATGGSESSEEDPFFANYGDVPLEELQSKYSRSGRVWTEVKDLNAEMKDKTVLIRGSAQAIRTLSKTAFIIIRQSKSNVQCVFSKDSLSAQMVKFAKDLSTESFVEVEGVVSVPNEAIKGTTQQVEIQGRKVYCINRAANLPFKIEDAARSEAEYEEAEQKGKQLVRVLQDTRLNYRVLDICTPANDAIFEIQFQVEEMFRQYLKSQGFRGIHSPKIIPGSSEGGAAVFKLDYMGQPACLAQSPQLYKQMAVKKFRKVFEVGPVFRAEKSYTHRHLCEFTGLDVEMEIKEHYFEVCDVVDKLFVAIFEHLNKNCAEDLKAIKEQYPFEDLKYLPKTLKLNYEEGIQMLKEAGVEIDPMGDLNTESEKKLGQLVREKYNTDFYILCRYPSGVRPFYTMPCYDDKNFSNSFDVFIRGEEIISGAQRIHEPELLTQRAIECGIDVKTISNYIDSFRYGPPPHGGFGVGLERVVMLFCNLNNIRKTSLFPRDPQRLSP